VLVELPDNAPGADGVCNTVTAKGEVEAPQLRELHAWTVYVYVPSARPDNAAKSVEELVVMMFVPFS
jgi:hypothetical protein